MAQAPIRSNGCRYSLEDRIEIEDVISTVSVYIDDHNFDAAEALFTETATFDYTSSYGPSRGPRMPKAEFWAGVRARHVGYEGVVHPSTNCVINVDGDTATCTSYVIALMNVESKTWCNGGVYRHELVRTGEGWRIQHLKYEIRFDLGDRNGVIEAAGRRILTKA